jgi:ABC-type multidrug transport system fused ATPase/permease subunit
VVNLLMRFYEIGSGRITLDGTDYRDLTRDQVRRCFGMVLPDTWLFAGTIRENIRYGRQDATDEEVTAAARAARAGYFIRTLPDGYDTLLDEEASNISAGQRQLLTIARAFLADPPILVLDEATSNVDTRTEILIQDAMAKLRQGRTSFVIAHRLSTIRNADTIVVMEDGRIIEQGTTRTCSAAAASTTPCTTASSPRRPRTRPDLTVGRGRPRLLPGSQVRYTSRRCRMEWISTVCLSSLMR